MIINLYTMQLLLGAVLLLLFCTLSDAQMQVTPGDEDSSCVRQNPAVPDNVKMLMNSRNYEQLLGVQGAVWDQIDFDDNDPPDPYNPTYVSDILYMESQLIFLQMPLHALVAQVVDNLPGFLIRPTAQLFLNDSFDNGALLNTVEPPIMFCTPLYRHVYTYLKRGQPLQYLFVSTMSVITVDKFAV